MNTEREQRNGTVRCVWEGTNGEDGIDVGDGSMLNNCLSHMEFANDQILQSIKMQSAEYDCEHTESEQRNARVRCVRQGINGGDGIDGGDGLMPNNRSSDVEFANDQTSQSANMLSADQSILRKYHFSLL